MLFEEILELFEIIVLVGFTCGKFTFVEFIAGSVGLGIALINHDTFPQMLKNGALDLVYTLNPIIEEEGLLLLQKKREELAFFANPNHPLAKKASVTEKDLADVPLLLTGHNCNFRHMLLEDLKRSGIAPRVALETSSKEVLK